MSRSGRTYVRDSRGRFASTGGGSKSSGSKSRAKAIPATFDGGGAGSRVSRRNSALVDAGLKKKRSTSLSRIGGQMDRKTGRSVYGKKTLVDLRPGSKSKAEKGMRLASESRRKASTKFKKTAEMLSGAARMAKTEAKNLAEMRAKRSAAAKKGAETRKANAAKKLQSMKSGAAKTKAKTKTAKVKPKAAPKKNS